MADSVQASQRGLKIVDQARQRKRWNKTAEVWLRRAYTSRATLNRFWAGSPIRREAFISICQAVDVDWEEVAWGEEQDEIERYNQDNRVSSHHDWGGAPDVSTFYGRSEELTILEQWLINDRCRLMVLLGMGGIGKTALTVKFAQQMQSNFESIIWRSLRNAPPLKEILGELLGCLSLSAENWSASLDKKIVQLIEYLRRSRCLLILDNVESVLHKGDRTGAYREGYEGYGQLFRSIGATAHQSALILTSREKPKGLSALEGEILPVRSLQLQGLSGTEGRAIFAAKGSFTGSSSEWQTLHRRYAGNPLALKIVASAVRDYFEGSICEFLGFTQQGPFVLDDIRELLAQQFHRLSELEQEIMYWLAINREPVSFQALQRDLVYPVESAVPIKPSDFGMLRQGVCCIP